MERYLNLSGDSPVTSYELGTDFILVRFRAGGIYCYGAVHPGQYHVDQMKTRAVEGRSLGTYISQHVRDQYESKE